MDSFEFPRKGGEASLCRSSFVVESALCFRGGRGQAAGVRFFNAPADNSGLMLTGAVWYPCAAPQQETKIGGRVITGTKDCPTAGEKLPFIVLSHGRTAWFGAHHDTAVALADAGFVVAAINHPGDNSFDHSQTDDLSVFVERPVDIKRLVDFMLGAWSDAAKIHHELIGLFDFSMSGYTGLVVIGGNPDFRKGLPGCEESSYRVCEQLRNNEIPTEPLLHDLPLTPPHLLHPCLPFLFPP